MARAGAKGTTGASALVGGGIGGDIQDLINSIRQENAEHLQRHKQELEGQLLSAIRQIHSEVNQNQAVQSVAAGSAAHAAVVAGCKVSTLYIYILIYLYT